MNINNNKQLLTLACSILALYTKIKINFNLNYYFVKIFYRPYNNYLITTFCHHNCIIRDAWGGNRDKVPQITSQTTT